MTPEAHTPAQASSRALSHLHTDTLSKVRVAERRYCPTEGPYFCGGGGGGGAALCLRRARCCPVACLGDAHRQICQKCPAGPTSFIGLPYDICRSVISAHVTSRTPVAAACNAPPNSTGLFVIMHRKGGGDAGNEWWPEQSSAGRMLAPILKMDGNMKNSSPNWLRYTIQSTVYHSTDVTVR